MSGPVEHRDATKREGFWQKPAWGDRIPDIMIADFPYSKHTHKSAVSQSAKGGVRARDLGFEFLSEELREAGAWFAGKTKTWSLIYSDIESVGLWKDALERNRATYVRAIPWVRWSMPQLSGDRPPQGCEMVIVAYGSGKGKKKWNGPGNLTSLTHTCLRGDGKHKTEKPLDQLLDLVSWFSEPGQLVFDPVAGSGTTGVACRLLRREFFGYEIDRYWVDRANERIATAQSGNRPCMSKRDTERLLRWENGWASAQEEMARIKKNTAAIRAKLDASKVAPSAKADESWIK